VAQILKAKYYPTVHFLKAKAKTNMSYTWKSILHASWIIQKGSYWTIGNGASIDLWEDNWIHQKSNSSTWSSKPASTPYQKVKDILVNNGNEWNGQLINQLFIPIEAQQILKIPIIDSSQEDSLTWEGTPDGNYTVKSGYQAISYWEQTTIPGAANTSGYNNDLWGQLWKINVPPKQSYLTWRILNKALPVKDQLFKRGVHTDPLCPRCQNQVETIKHAFLDCFWAQQVWLASPLTINLSNNHFESVCDWYEYMFKHTEKDTKELIVAITYGIWYARNQLIFQEKFIPPFDVCTIAVTQL
jgi:hypothetical protein